MADAPSHDSSATQQTAVNDMGASQDLDEEKVDPSLPPPKIDSSKRRRARRQHTSNSIDMSEYFVGPRDTSKHSKWPTFMRMHGSIVPEMIIPMIFVSCWSVAITSVHMLVHRLDVDSILLTILGFVVGLGLSFRSSSAYERYCDGRKYWAQLTVNAQTMGRTIWQHTSERDGDVGKADLLAKMSALNLIWAFAVSLKHKLRFEPYQHYEDIKDLVGYLDTFAKAAESTEAQIQGKPNAFKRTGEYLGVPFAESNPRKTLKKARRPLGNLPLEILSYLGGYVDSIVENGTLTNGIHQATLINGMTSMNEVLVGNERVLNTPLPVAYSIAISQMTWIYVAVLPFQLVGVLEWITIPGSVVGAYIILAMALIGNEIENPFGNDVNDLPLDDFCDQIGNELDVISAAPRRQPREYMRNNENKVLYPLSPNGYKEWKGRNVDEIRDALRTKASLSVYPRQSEAHDRSPNAQHV